MKQLLNFFLVTSLLLFLCGCTPETPTISNSPVTSSTTSATVSTTFDFDAWLSGLYSATTTAAATTTKTSATVQTTTVKTTSTVTTTTSTTTTSESAAEAEKRVLSLYAALCRELGVFRSTDELSAAKIAQFLFAYGTKQTNAFNSLTTVCDGKRTVTVPIDTVDALCRQFFGRSYDFMGVSGYFYKNAVKVENRAAALVYAQYYSYGNDHKLAYGGHTVSGKRYTVTVSEPDTTYTLTLLRTETGFQYLSMQ